MRAAFVSSDPRLIERLEDKFELVISDRDDLKERCEKSFRNLAHEEGRIIQVLEEKGVSTAVCLGYQRLFSGGFIERCEAELYNLHPSLLPGFKGLGVYRRVVERGVRINGATFHRISEEMDEGEILDQVSYRVPEDADVEELKEKAADFEVELVRRNLD